MTRQQWVQTLRIAWYIFVTGAAILVYLYIYLIMPREPLQCPPPSYFPTYPPSSPPTMQDYERTA